MSNDTMIRQLKRLSVEGLPFACMGCGQEESCSLHGCAVIKAAIERLEASEEATE